MDTHITYNNMVSIITPTYNCARFIVETIKSVQAQTYTNWEMIISDDCSTDNTREVIAPFLESDSRIKYICNEQNSGAAITRNNALKVAQGRWIAFLDSDDLWLPEKLERQIAFMEQNGYLFSYHEYTEISEEGVDLGVYVSGPKKISKIGMYGYCWPGCLTVMYAADRIGKQYIPDIKKNNDYAMWLKVIDSADCFLMKKSLAKYRKREGSISRHSYYKLLKWHYILFRQVIGCGVLLSSFLTCSNVILGCVKKIIYKHSA